MRTRKARDRSLTTRENRETILERPMGARNGDGGIAASGDPHGDGRRRHPTAA